MTISGSLRPAGRRRPPRPRLFRRRRTPSGARQSPNALRCDDDLASHVGHARPAAVASGSTLRGQHRLGGSASRALLQSWQRLSIPRARPSRAAPSPTRPRHFLRVTSTSQAAMNFVCRRHSPGTLGGMTEAPARKPRVHSSATTPRSRPTPASTCRASSPPGRACSWRWCPRNQAMRCWTSPPGPARLPARPRHWLDRRGRVRRGHQRPPCWRSAARWPAEPGAAPIEYVESSATSLPLPTPRSTWRTVSRACSTCPIPLAALREMRRCSTRWPIGRRLLDPSPFGLFRQVVIEMGMADAGAQPSTFGRDAAGSTETLQPRVSWMSRSSIARWP